MLVYQRVWDINIYVKLLNQQPVNDCPSISPFTSDSPARDANAKRMSMSMSQVKLLDNVNAGDYCKLTTVVHV